MRFLWVGFSDVVGRFSFVKKCLEVFMNRAIALLFLLLVLGCHGPVGDQPSVVLRGSPPLHFLLLQDVSRSIEGKVPRLNPAELEPVLDIAEKHGGTVAICSFGVGSRPTVRAVFDPPSAGDSSEPVNVFLRRPQNDQAQARAEEEYAAYCVAERERFLAEVAELLEESANATNLVAGLTRAVVFFAEASEGSHQIFLVVSDFLDNSGATSFDLTLDPNVRVLLVSDGVDFGLLQPQSAAFEKYESVSAAIRAAVPSGY